MVINSMDRFTLDGYVVDTLMADLVGHDRRPASFIVFLALLREAGRRRNDTVVISLQSLASATGLSKSTVQVAIRHLRRRRLLDPTLEATVTRPARRVMRPWQGRR
jgi:hypothetical protein